MLQELADRHGEFYIIQLRPHEDPRLVKLGWSSSAIVRLRQHRAALMAPDARIVAWWPCLRGWELWAKRATVGQGTRPVFGEQYRSLPVEELKINADCFFTASERDRTPFVPPAREVPMPAVPLYDNTLPALDGPTVTATKVAAHLGVPRYVVYRLVEAGKIPGHVQPRQPWHDPKRKRWGFYLSEVEQAYARLKASLPAD